MLSKTEQLIEGILNRYTDELDITPAMFRKVEGRYKAVGDYLIGSESPISKYSPEVYPQGSFRLGTVVKPWREGKEAEYDVDLVLQMNTPKSLTSPIEIKMITGDRLRDHETYAAMLQPEGKRCWTIQYSESNGVDFHMDVLPCIGEDERTINHITSLPGANASLASEAIAITDKSKQTNQYSWGSSNPKGFGEWFDSKKAGIFHKIAAERKRLILEQVQEYGNVDEIPDVLVRTPLQRAIQILKRHRDIMFDGRDSAGERPISMVITTLAATAYSGEEETLTTLRNIVGIMFGYAKDGRIGRPGAWRILNPVNPEENFADKWNQPDSRRAELFFKWLEDIHQSLSLALQTLTAEGVRKAFKQNLGEKAINEAITRYEIDMTKISSPRIIAAPPSQAKPVRRVITEESKPWSA